MNNLENIFSERIKRERQTRVTYSKYIFNSHLIMFLIIVFGAVMINYSRWLEIASTFELNAVFIAATIVYSYLVVSARVKTFLKEADSVFLLPLENYYGKLALKTTLIGAVNQIILLALFYIALIPIIDKIGNISNVFSKIGLVQLIVLVFLNRLYRLFEVIYFGEKYSTKVIFFVAITLQIINIVLDFKYLGIINLILILLVSAMLLSNFSKAKKMAGDNASSYYLLNWNEAAEYDKHRNENYLKFVNMFVDVPLSGIKVSRRKYFDILLPKLTDKNFTKENSFTYYYYRVFLRQENTVFLVFRLILISGIILYSFNNIYVSAAVIISYAYLTIIQLIPLYKQISNNIWHSILPVSEVIKIKSFKKLLTLVMLFSTIILSILSIVFSEFNMLNLIINVGSLLIANILSRVFITKIK